MTTLRLKAILGTSPPILFALLIFRLWLTGTLGYYVNDRTVWIVLLGAALFALVGSVGVYSAIRHAERQRAWWQSAAFLAPVLLGLFLPAHPLSAISGQSSSLGSLQLASHVSAGGAGDTFGSWVSALSAHPEPSWWSGQQVTLVGFVAQQAGLPAHSFIVGRYLVTCCVVDATLLGFPVQMKRGAIPPAGTWIQVAGSFGRQYWTDPSGAHYPIVENARLSRVTIPSSPYLSP